MALNYVTLTGTLPGCGGAEAVFTPSGWLTDATDEELLPPRPAMVTLAWNGTFSVALLATDNTPPLAAGWLWSVTISGIPGVQPETFGFALAYANGATQDISSLVELQATASMAQYMPVAGGIFTGPVVSRPVVLTDQPVIAINAALGNLFRVTIGGNRELGLPSNGLDGQMIRVEVIQGTGAPFTLTYAAGYDLGDTGEPELSTTPGARDVFGLSYTADDEEWDLLAFAPGF